MTDSITAEKGAPLSSRARDHRQRQTLEAALRQARYEVLPLDGTAAQVLEHVPKDVSVTVTASPRRGLDATLALSETLARDGYRVVPHLAARLVVDDAHLRETLQRIDEVGIADVFLVSGDGEPVGDFRDSLGLLTAMHRHRSAGLVQHLQRVGVTGYPEGHPLVPDEQLTEALRAKQPMSTYMVSQLCFDARAVSAWVRRMRQSGISLPLLPGVAGVVEQRKLLRVAQRIGVGQSARFLRKHRGIGRLLVPGGYRPDRLVRALAADLADQTGGMAGLHVYTFGAVAATEDWRRTALERLAGSTDDG